MHSAGISHFFGSYHNDCRPMSFLDVRVVTREGLSQHHQRYTTLSVRQFRLQRIVHVRLPCSKVYNRKPTTLDHLHGSDGHPRPPCRDLVCSRWKNLVDDTCHRWIVNILYPSLGSEEKILAILKTRSSPLDRPPFPQFRV